MALQTVTRKKSDRYRIVLTIDAHSYGYHYQDAVFYEEHLISVSTGSSNRPIEQDDIDGLISDLLDRAIDSHKFRANCPE